MKHFKCRKCHHEWDGSDESFVCDWCEAGGVHIELEAETAFSKFVRDFFKAVKK